MVTQKNSFSGSFLVRQCADKKSMYGFYENICKSTQDIFASKALDL